MNTQNPLNELYEDLVGLIQVVDNDELLDVVRAAYEERAADLERQGFEDAAREAEFIADYLSQGMEELEKWF